GRRMLGLPVHPRLARLLIAAAARGMLEEGAAIAAPLSEKDILRRSGDVHPRDRRPTVQAESDLIVRLDVLNSRGRGDEVEVGALRQVEKTRDELMRMNRGLGVPPEHLNGSADRREHSGETPKPRSKAPLSILRLPLWAYPDRVCRRRVNDAEAAAMVG